MDKKAQQIVKNGIYSALEIPMKDDESIDFSQLEKLIEYELSIGVEGFYCSGSSGEGLLLSLSERNDILDCVVSTVRGRAPVIAHVGTIRTQDMISMAHHAQDTGVNQVSMIPPYYYKYSMQEIIQYYKDVLNALPDLEIIIYNIPQFTGIEFNVDNASELLENERVIGVKHTSYNLYSLERMKKAFPDKIFFNGFDEQYTGAIVMGADAAIGTSINLYAPLFRRIRQLLEEGNIREAKNVQAHINERIEIMCKYGIFNAVKYMLTLRGVTCGACRKPFERLDEEAKKELQKLHECDMTEWN